MELKTFAITTPQTAPPEREGWIRYWHGHFQMRKVKSDDKRLLDQQEDREARERGCLTERDVEIQVFLNMLHDIEEEQISMFELGAGRGDWCLALAGVTDHRLVPLIANSYRCLALEGEPFHYAWTRQHFEVQKINGVAVHGALSHKDGSIRFRASKAPEESYGQGIDPERGNIEVPAYTIDTLMRKHGFPRLSCIHMDVQGAEYDAIRGAASALREGRVDYLHIGTHGGDALDDKLLEYLGPDYEVVFRVPAAAGEVDTVFGRAWIPKDGILLVRRRK